MNGFIGKNGKIMSKITLQFPPVDGLTEINFGQRIYRKISFENNIRVSELPTVLPLVKKISSHLKEIELGTQLSFSVGVSIIKQCKDANKIRANFKGNIQRLAKPSAALDFPLLKILEINNSWKNVDLFENCHLLETLTFSVTRYGEREALLLKKFLIKKNCVKSLNIGHNDGLFRDNILAESKFQLKDLVYKISTPHLTAEAKVNIQNFLQLHRNTLESLDTTKRIWNLLATFLNLRLLHCIFIVSEIMDTL